MTYWPLAQFLCTPEYLEDLEAVDRAWAEYGEWGKHEVFKSDFKPSTIVDLFSQIDTEALREKIDQMRSGPSETDGPFTPISAERGYESLLDHDWVGDDADAFAEYVEGTDGTDNYFAQIRANAADVVSAFETLADDLDEACEDLYEFCLENVVGFADKYDGWAALGTALSDSLAAGVIGAAAGAAGGAPLAGVGAVVGAIIMGIVTFVLTFIWRVIQLDAELMNRAAELMQALNPQQYINIDDGFRPIDESVPR